MEISDWMRGAGQLHALLREAAARTAPAVLPITRLHAPHLGPDLLSAVCKGCDRALATQPEAPWPCRTYTLLCRGLLDVTNVERTVERLA